MCHISPCCTPPEAKSWARLNLVMVAWDGGCSIRPGCGLPVLARGAVPARRDRLISPPRRTGFSVTNVSAREASERFSPEVRGWAALRLIPLVPRPLREEIESRASADGRSKDRFRRDALALVSRPESIAWSRWIAERIPALGPGAGPACLMRLWAARLVAPDGRVEAYWPDLVGDVWRVAAPALAMMGLATRGPGCEDLQHEVAVPLAWVFLGSLAAGRRDTRIVGEGAPGRPDGPPFGWAPGIDAFPSVLRYLLLGQVPNRFRSHAFLVSPLARLVCALGLAVPRSLVRRLCPQCRRRWPRDAGVRRCPHCEVPLVLCRSRRLVSRARLETRLWGEEGPKAAGGSVLGARPAGRLSVPERAEARLVRRECLRRARRLWRKVIEGRRYGVPAMVVLGALAGVRPLASVAARPRPKREWLERLVDMLAEGCLAREPVAARANAALRAVAIRLGRCRPAPAITAAYVGVLATRFRQCLFGRPGEASGRGVRTGGRKRGVENRLPAGTMLRNGNARAWQVGDAG